MKQMVRYGLTLSVICIIASASLALVYSLTRNKIALQAQAEEASSVKEVLPNAAKFEEVKKDGEILYYKAFTQDGKFMGVAFKAQGKGYSSTIETMVGLDSEGKITEIRVISQNETPGLGANVTGREFIGQFRNKQIEELSAVQAITGATISSKAVIDSVSRKAEEIKGLIKNGK